MAKETYNVFAGGKKINTAPLRHTDALRLAWLYNDVELGLSARAIFNDRLYAKLRHGYLLPRPNSLAKIFNNVQYG